MEKMQFNKRFRDLYDLSGCTSITQFAKLLGMNRQSVDRYYNNQRIPDAPALAQICEKMNISADWLLGLSDIKSTSYDVQTCVKTTGLSEKAVEKIAAVKPYRDLSDLLPTDYSEVDGEYVLTNEGREKVKKKQKHYSIMVKYLSRLIETERFSGLIMAYKHFLDSAALLDQSTLEYPQYRTDDIETVVLNREEATRYYMRRVSDEIMFICEEEFKKHMAVAVENERKRNERMIEEEDPDDQQEEE